MVKFQTFQEIFPEGICVLCRKPCEDGAIFHFECAIAYEELKREKRRKETNK